MRLPALILWSARLKRRSSMPSARATEAGGFPGLLHKMRASDRRMTARSYIAFEGIERSVARLATVGSRAGRYGGCCEPRNCQNWIQF